MDGPLVPSRAEYLAILRNDLMSFAQKCFHELEPGKTFLPNWHQEAIVEALNANRLGYLQRLIISVPPRSMKSILVSVAYVAFLLGHDPAMRIIVASYGSDLSIKLANDCRRIMMAPWYRELFPNTQISRLKNTELEVMTTKGVVASPPRLAVRSRVAARTSSSSTMR